MHSLIELKMKEEHNEYFEILFVPFHRTIYSRTSMAQTPLGL